MGIIESRTSTVNSCAVVVILLGEVLRVRLLRMTQPVEKRKELESLPLTGYNSLIRIHCLKNLSKILVQKITIEIMCC